MFKKNVIFTIFVIISFCLGYFFPWKFNFITSWSDNLSSVTSAFYGAFFAFLFFILANGIRRISDRIIKHYNTVVRTEKILIDNYEVSNHILFVIDDLRKSIEESRKMKQFIINPNVLEEFVVDTYYLSDLIGVNLTNKMESLFVYMRRVNRGIFAVNKHYSSISNRVMERNLEQDEKVKKIIIQEYLDNINTLDENLNSLKKMIEIEIRPSMKKISAYVRVLLKKKPLSKIIFDNFFAGKYNKVKDSDIEVELEKLEEELIKNEKEHRKKLEKIYEK